MEQKETATQKNSEAENKAEELKNVKDKSPTTPTTPGSTWGSTWGGWLSQAKEKVSRGQVYPPHHLLDCPHSSLLPFLRPSKTT